ELTQFIKGPDFPTAGIILGQEGIKNAYATGHGRIVVQAKVLVEDIPGDGRRQIVVTELPYQTDKAALVVRIAEQVKAKKITGISELRDESDRQGMRIVIELRVGAQPQQVLNSLYKYTAMQSAFFVNMLALVDGQPKVISLKEALQCHIDFRHKIITRRSRFELKVAKERAHILEGLKIALDNIDRVIATIRKAANAEIARQDLMSVFGLSKAQAQAILDMQLRRLANLERKKIFDEYAEVVKTIAYLEDLLANPRRILALIKQDVEGLNANYGDPRRTEISEQEALDFDVEDLIPHQRVAVTLSKRGFIKRVPSQAYKPQHRGGKGIIGMVTREADAVRILAVADTHDNLLFFTNKGKVFNLKCYEIPADSSRTAKGMAIVNLFPITDGERVTAMVIVRGFKPDTYLLQVTRHGEIKKTSLDNFASVRSSGLIAMDLEEGDELVAAGLAADQDDVILVSQKGQSIRFRTSSLRASSRTSGGVRGIRLAADDQVIGMDVSYPDAFLLIITSGGYGKLTPIAEYPRQHRAGSGVRTFKLTEKTGGVAAARLVSVSQQLMIISADGIVTRTPVKEKDPRKGITSQKRSTQGVRLMKLAPNDRIVAIALLDTEKDSVEQKAAEGGSIMSIPSFSLEGKAAIITGGKQGIGRAIALAFAEAGADVAVCGRVIEDGKLQAVADEIQRLGRRSLAVQVDISRKADVDNLVQRVMDEFGSIDILVNNAGKIILKPLLDTPEDEWDEIIDINLKGYYLCSQAAGRIMVERKSGTIINIGSRIGIRALKNRAAYSIAKAGVLMLTRLLALELAEHNIRVNAIGPGIVKTELTRALWSDPETLKKFESTIPLGGRWAEPGDIVGAALFLASDASSYITGDTILVDGGANV
ncbi:MAG: glucose 1-dehydrogenase, partial [Dehalococcoidales bacterium]